MGRPPIPTPQQNAPKKEKTFKPKVLVYGNGVDAFAAAVQAAQSGVQTLWVMEAARVESSLTKGAAKTVEAYGALPLGSWALYLRALAKVQQGSDSAYRAARTLINPQIAINTFEDTGDTVKNLQIKRNTAITAIKKSGKGYEVTYANKEKQKFAALVDASAGLQLFRLIDGNHLSDGMLKVKRPLSLDTHQITYENTSYRTGVALTEWGGRMANLPLSALLSDTASNLFATKGFEGNILNEEDAQQVPQLMLQGQAAGALAAYCAFFSTTTAQVGIRTLQGELLAYGAWLLPFQDIRVDHPNAGAFQRVGATGLLQGHYDKQDQFLFSPDSAVSIQDIQDILEQLYTRSQIWFLQHKDISRLTLAQTLSLIKYLGSRGNELDAEVEKGWSRRFKFDTDFDPERPVTRREFAVLADAYLQPFNLKVDLDGNFSY